MIGGKTAYSGEPIAGYYRVPGGFKLSQHVRVPRELLVLPDGIAHLLFPYRYIYLEPSDIAESSIYHVLRPPSFTVSAEITRACLYKALSIYQCMERTYSKD